MNPRPLAFVVFLIVFLAACNQFPSSGPTGPTVAAQPTGTPLSASPTAVQGEAQTPTPVAPTATIASLAMPTRIGAEHVLRLPRESAVPAGWQMDPIPGYEARDPLPGQTYHFACVDLPARSIGVASVGYRHLEGLPNVYVEYVIYPSAVEAAAAIEDMRLATETCDSFTIGSGEGAIEATFAPLEFPSYGDDSFAATLTTTGPTAELLTHAIKIQSGRIVAGINHAAYLDAPPPDEALTRSLAELVVENLADEFH